MLMLLVLVLTPTLVCPGPEPEPGPSPCLEADAGLTVDFRVKAVCSGAMVMVGAKGPVMGMLEVVARPRERRAEASD